MTDGQRRPRLYLSSYLLGDDGGASIRWNEAFAGRRGRAAIVMNALDLFGATRMRSWEREVARVEPLGYDVEELDLREYAGQASELVARLNDLDLLWIVGGNAFWLGRVMGACEFGSALSGPLERGTLTYAGYSAAACVAGPDLRGIDLMDEPDRVPEEHADDWPVTTLGLVPYRIVPHWQSDHGEAADAELARQWLEREGLAHRCLRDGEVITIA